MKNIKIELKWALIFIVVQLLWMVGEKAVGLHDTHIDQHATYTMLFALPAIAMYVFALLDKRKNFYGGAMTYLQGLKAGIIITVIVTLLTPLAQYIISTVITPDYFDNAIEYVVAHEQMTQQEAEDYFNLQAYLWQAVFGALLLGVVTSAVVAIFTRKKSNA